MPSSPSDPGSASAPALRISVVIPAYGRADLLRKAVLSLSRQDLPKNEYEVIVVDSSPDRANATLLEELAPQLSCSLRWFTKKAEGPGPSRNLGASESRGNVIAFMDSDCEATPAWLREGLAAFREGVGIVQGRTLPDPAVRRGVFSHYVQVEQESPLYETANIFYLRAAFQQSGGFSADLTPTAHTPMGGEDTQLAWSVIRRGWKTAFSSGALMYHAIFPLGPWQWLFIKRLYGFPRLTRYIPGFRRHLFAFYFLDLGQALFTLTLAGIVLGVFHPWALLLAAPYAVFRASEPTQSLKGVLRPLRIAPYFARDVFSFLILVTASLRYRSLVL